jgi:hypothetical protein
MHFSRKAFAHLLSEFASLLPGLNRSPQINYLFRTRGAESI